MSKWTFHFGDAALEHETASSDQDDQIQSEIWKADDANAGIVFLPGHNQNTFINMSHVKAVIQMIQKNFTPITPTIASSGQQALDEEGQ